MPGAEISPNQPPPLTPGQISALERLLNAGFQVVTVEHVTRYLAVEKEGFVALLDPADGGLKIYGQVGYQMGGGIGVLVERGSSKAFVWHGEKIDVSRELLETYKRINRELNELIERASAT